MHDWHEAPLQDFLTRITYGFTNPMPTTESGPYMVTARDINGGRILYEQVRSTSEQAYRNDITDKSRPDIGDVLVTKDGTLGRIATVDRKNVCVNQSVALLKPSDRVRSRFLKYLLKEPMNYARMIGDADGTTIKHIYITRLGKMLVRVPPLGTQDEIVAILGALDDKIELNRRMNETLEAMARAIFKDWFVDFGPTRARAEGRDPYLVPELWDLFPDRLGDKDIPTGWRVGTIGDCFRLTMGQSPPGSTYNEKGNGLPFFQGRKDFGFRYPEKRKYCTGPTRIAERDDTLVSVRAPVGDINMALEQCCAGRGVAALRHKSSSRSFTYYSAAETKHLV